MMLAAEIAVSALLVIGGGFVLVGSWGLAKLPTLMARLHGPSKATTLGVGSCLLASMIYFPAFAGRATAHELLIALFLFLTAPVTAHMIAKAHLHVQAQRARGGEARGTAADPEPPSAGPGRTWSTLDPPPPAGEPPSP
jgi:multicomponent K+:H+ antiporter subunit G